MLTPTNRYKYIALLLLPFTGEAATLPYVSGVTDLGTLRSDNSGDSRVNAISSDGSVVAGTADNDVSASIRATVWSGNNWSTKTDLGTLRSDNSGYSGASAISSDGSVVAGFSENDAGFGHATVWSGNSWSTKTDLGTLRSNNSGGSWVNAVSSDGSVVAGLADNDMGANAHATVWSGNNWSTKTDLGTLRSDNSGYSEAFAISSDGSVVAGIADTDAVRSSHAAVWSGNNWSTKTDLGTLRSDNSGYSWVKAISSVSANDIRL